MKTNRSFTLFLAVALFCSCLAIPASAISPESEARFKPTTIELVPVAIVDSEGNYASLTSQANGSPSAKRAVYLKTGESVLFGDSYGNMIPVGSYQGVSVTVNVSPSATAELGYTRYTQSNATWFYYSGISKTTHTASTTISSANNYYFAIKNTSGNQIEVTGFSVTLL